MNLELVFSAIGAVAMLISGAWALMKIVVSQFEKRLDERFTLQERAREEGRRSYEKRLQTLEEENRHREREHLKLIGEMPREYVRREDYVRNQTIIEAKLDALALRLENMNLKGLTRD